MRVHLATDTWSIGGGLEHIYQISRGMAEIDFKIYATSDPVRDGDESVRPVTEKFSTLKNTRLVFGPVSRADLSEGKPDLIHIHHLKSLLFFLGNPLARSSVPVVFTAHGLHLHKYEFARGGVRRFANFCKYRLRLGLERYLFKRADRIIAVSHEDDEFIKNVHGVDAVTYLTNGIAPPPPELSAASRSGLRKLLDLPRDRFLFVTVARFNFQKGLDVLVRALAAVRDFLDRSKVGFILVGDGPEMDAVRRLARTLDVEKHITFVGARPNAVRYIKAADVFLLPSRWEGLPIVALECGLLNVPVLASDTYGNREILADERGVLFENLNPGKLGDAIRAAAGGGYPLETMAAALRREVETRYGLGKMIDGLREIYRTTAIPS